MAAQLAGNAGNQRRKSLAPVFRGGTLRNADNLRTLLIAQRTTGNMKKDLSFLRLKKLPLLILGVVLWLLALMASVIVIAVLHHYDHSFLPFLSAIF